MKSITILLLAILLSGCAYRITDIDVSKSDPQCVRQCTQDYSSCVSQGNQVGFKTETLRACRDAYSICTQSCPTQQE